MTHKTQNLTNLVAEISRYAVHQTTDNVARDVSKLQKLSNSLRKLYSLSDKTNEEFEQIRALEKRARELGSSLKVKTCFDYFDDGSMALTFDGKERVI